MRLKLSAVLLAVCLGAAGCTRQPVPINPGTDACEHCKMTIMDNRFGGEVITSKGKYLLFDAGECLTDYLREHKLGADAEVYLVNFLEPGAFVPANGSLIVVSPEINSPMGGNMLAIAAADSSQREIRSLQNKQFLTWHSYAETVE